jgi:hypothetical protein
MEGGGDCERKEETQGHLIKAEVTRAVEVERPKSLLGLCPLEAAAQARYSPMPTTLRSAKEGGERERDVKITNTRAHAHIHTYNKPGPTLPTRPPTVILPSVPAHAH